jgi:hypothetical protein
MGGEFDGGVADDIADGGLRRDIAVADQRLRARAGNRRGGDDAATAPALHMGGGKPNGHERRRQVQFDSALKQCEVHGVDGAARRQFEARPGADAGIGEDGVETAVPLRGAADRGTQVLGVADVDDGLLDRTSHGREARRCFVEPGRVYVAQHDTGPVLGHHFGKGETKAACRTGDERDMAIDVEQVLPLHCDPLRPWRPVPRRIGSPLSVAMPYSVLRMTAEPSTFLGADGQQPGESRANRLAMERACLIDGRRSRQQGRRP